MDQGRESKKVVDAVKDWEKSEAQDSARRNAKGKRGRIAIMSRSSSKIYGLKEFLMDVCVTDKVSDIVRQIPKSACYSKQDMYVTCEGTSASLE